MMKVIELFSGLGSQTQALKNIDMPHEVVATSEIDKYAVQSYEALHGKANNLGDITKIEKLPQSDLRTYSFPCFVGNTLILTENGYKQIEDIQQGDKVLTHSNRYKEVIATMNQGEKSVVKISAMGVDEIKCTPNHRFYVREKYRKYLHNPNKNLRLFKKPEWKEAKDLTKADYFGVAINQNEIVPSWDGIAFEWRDGRRTRYKSELNCQMYNPNFWWIIGRYIGDGWERSQGGIIICCAKDELNEITNRLDKLFNYCIVEEKSTYKIHIVVKELGLFVSQFGKGAANKKLTKTIFDLPKDLLRFFLAGYLSADGCYTKELLKASSVNRELIYGIGQCIAKVFNRPYSIYKSNRPSKYIIEGREVNQKSVYVVTCKLWNSKQDQAFYEDGYVWFPFRGKEDCGNEIVYDISVAEDESFTANGVIVHNCQDISIAGHQAGIKEGTRSGLLFEVERLLRVANSNGTLPKYLLLENVKNLIGKRFKADFDSWLLFLSNIGYANYYKVLNAKHYGIPQNRERVFCVSILGEHEPYKFPEPFPLELRLKDMLEENVPEKYYISNTRLNSMLGSNFHQRRDSVLRLQSISPTILTRDFREPKCVILGELSDEKYSKMIESSRRSLSEADISSCTTSNCGGSTEPKVAVEERFYFQALETLNKNDCKVGDTVDAFNKKVNKSGISPTITTRPEGFKTAILPVVEEPKIIYEPPLIKDGWHRKAKEVISSNGICTCIHAQSNNLLQKITEPIICASRGRNPENPSSRLAGEKTEQRLEFNENGTTNTITTVQKDNLVVCEERKDEGLRFFSDDCTGALRTTDSCGDKRILEVENIRVRKLTPKKCLRLMGWKDEQIDKIKNAGISNCQQYRQAGNSICVPVLMSIFGELFGYEYKEKIENWKA